ncbi:MAG: MFS transporter [Oscillospiraceae bacterium]|jgi:MFS family permease|nr:MFS transporter [Oscillospiraceae bacterium]
MSDKQTKSAPLWTKNFTIITLGTIVSMLGNAISGFAIGLLVLDYTDSVFLFALFMVVYNLPKIIMPMIAGPYLDNYSRTKVIYTLDFLSSALYLGIFFMLRADIFEYSLFLGLAMLIGTIDSIYQVAYDSLYPVLISEGNYRKAYSISSMILPLSSVMVPIAAFLYDTTGLLHPLFLFNAVTFFFAAVCETQIHAPESQIARSGERFSFRKYQRELREGLAYIRGETGLQVITAYFFVFMLATGVSGTVVLPYFKAQEGLGVFWYTWVMGGAIVGRIAGGAFQYRHSYPTAAKYWISIVAYLLFSVIEGGYLFLPVIAMIGVNFISGALSVTVFNIRIAATQSYVPNCYRGRFNGTVQMIGTMGTIMGQLMSGAMADWMDERLVLVLFMGLNLLAVLAILLPGRKAVSAIYNRDVDGAAAVE